MGLCCELCCEHVGSSRPSYFTRALPSVATFSPSAFTPCYATELPGRNRASGPDFGGPPAGRRLAGGPIRPAVGPMLRNSRLESGRIRPGSPASDPEALLRNIGYWLPAELRRKTFLEFPQPVTAKLRTCHGRFHRPCPVFRLMSRIRMSAACDVSGGSGRYGGSPRCRHP